MKLVKKWDVIIIVLLAIISIVPYLIFIKYQNNYKGETYAVIYIDGKENRRIRLDNNKGHQEFIIETKEGYNNIVIDKESISINNSNCKDKTCTTFGFVKKVGDKIVCLPHKLIIEIKGNAVSHEEEDFISR